MDLVVFKHRATVPENPVIGTFYWVDKEDDTSELWFSSRNGLIRLDNYFDRSEIEDIISRVSGAESDIESIQETLDEINDNIENTVKNKLTWQII